LSDSLKDNNCISICSVAIEAISFKVLIEI